MQDTPSPHADASIPDEPAPGGESGTQQPASEATGFWGRHHWVPYVLPLAVYMLLGTLEPKAQLDTSPAEVAGATDEAPAADEPDGRSGWHFLSDSRWYPLAYTLRLAVTVACVLLVLPAYRQYPWQVSPLALGVGCLGAVVWIGLCLAGLEQRLLVPLGLGNVLGLGERAAYNPLAALDHNLLLLAGFLVVRFTGLALVVPLIEEFFLRGFLMRFVIDPQWWKVRIGTPQVTSLVVGTLYGVLAHPAEMFAAAVWFSLISWLMLRTRNIWDCVAAHAVTNLLLGVFVLLSGHWELW